MSVFSRRRAKRALVSLCASFLLLAFAASAGVQDARVLWVTLPGSVLRVSPLDGSVAMQLTGLKQPGSLVVEGTNDSVWIYGQKGILGYDAQGNLLVSLSLPNNFHGGTPAGMAVDNAAGNIWIAIKKDLYRLDMGGNLKADIALPYNANGLSLDAADSRLWVAEQGGIQTFDSAGNAGLNLTLSADNPPTAIAYDATLKQAWVLFAGSVERLDAAGNVAASAALASDLSQFIAADREGGAWVVGQQNLAHLDTTGQAQFLGQPFAGLSGGNALVLVADPLDHSAWVANTLHLRHYGSNGGFISEATLPTGPGNGNGLNQVGLYVDTVPPIVSISTPADGIYTNHNQPTLTLAYSDIGSGVDPTSVAVSNGGTTVAVSCQASSDGSGAACAPSSPLPDGVYSLSVTVKDYAGNVSEAATVSFTVDTVPPTITITSPLSTGAPDYTLTGNLSEAGTLTINGTSVPVNPDDSFSEALTLKPGPNSFAIVATDLAGNVTNLMKPVTLQSVPLGGLSGDLVQFQPSGTGTQTLVGQAGAATPGETVTVVDVNSGQSASGTVNADGSFSISLPGAGTDDFSITLTGAGVTTPQTFYLHPTDAAMQLAVTSPSSGSSIDADDITVSGTYAGPLNMGITVNGQPAAMFDGQFVVNNLKLASGSNMLTVVATTGGNLKLTRTVTVTSLGTSALVVTPLSTSGFAPFDAIFKIEFLGDTPLSEVDFTMGDGHTGVVWGFQLDEFEYPISNTYQTPGVYTVNVTAYDDNGAQYQTQVTIVVQDPNQADAVFTGIWSDVTGALAGGNKSAAMNLLDYTAQHNYSQVFDTLMPNMKAIVGSFSPPMQSSISAGVAEYAVARIRNGQAYLYLVDFVQGEDGVWRLESM